MLPACHHIMAVIIVMVLVTLHLVIAQSSDAGCSSLVVHVVAVAQDKHVDDMMQAVPNNCVRSK